MKNSIMVLKGQKLVEVKIEGNEVELETIQNEVDGYIELFSPDRFQEQGINLFVNEEGKIKNLLPTLVVIRGNDIVEQLRGNVVFASYDNEGRTLPLNKKQKEFIKKNVTEEIFFTVDAHVFMRNAIKLYAKRK